MNIFKKFYILSSGYSYTNMGRLFLRLFVGIMLMQFGIRQISALESPTINFPHVLGLGSEASMILMIAIEIGCSLFIMAGFLTRLMTLPPLVAMIIAEYYLLNNAVSTETWMLNWWQLGYLPIMFAAIYFFLILVGPGKISVDYFLSLHFIHQHNHSETDLEEV